MSAVSRLAIHSALAGVLSALLVVGDPSWRIANFALAALNAWYAGKFAALLDNATQQQRSHD